MEEALAELLELETEYDDMSWYEREINSEKKRYEERKVELPPAWKPIPKQEIISGIEKLDAIEVAIPILSGYDVLVIFKEAIKLEEQVSGYSGQQRYKIKDILWYINYFHKHINKVLSSGVTRYSMK
jgi:hypothetical protein